MYCIERLDVKFGMEGCGGKGVSLEGKSEHVMRASVLVKAMSDTYIAVELLALRGCIFKVYSCDSNIQLGLCISV